MASTPSSEAAPEGPVMTLFYKRLRALKKKLNKIDQMEKALKEGEKALNSEQMEMLRTKPAVAAVFGEIEKLLPAMAAAVSEEVTLAAKENCNECQGKKILAKTRSKRRQKQESQDKALAAAAENTFQLPVETNLVQSEVDSVPVQFQLEELNYVQLSVDPILMQPKELNYVQLPVEPILVQSEVDSAPVEFQQKVEEPAVYQENGTHDNQSNYVEEAPGTYDSQSSYVEEAPKVESQPEDLTTKDVLPEDLTTKNVSQTNSQEEQTNEESEWTEINRNGSRRNYNNHRGRGSGRRGFMNGRGARGRSRGGGPYYSNGQRSQQNSENGNFYPRSYYNNKGRGGGKVDNNHGSGAQGVVTAVES